MAIYSRFQWRWLREMAVILPLWRHIRSAYEYVTPFCALACRSLRDGVCLVSCAISTLSHVNSPLTALFLSGFNLLLEVMNVRNYVMSAVTTNRYDMISTQCSILVWLQGIDISRNILFILKHWGTITPFMTESWEDVSVSFQKEIYTKNLVSSQIQINSLHKISTLNSYLKNAEYFNYKYNLPM
jgi:hypothetical protein